MAIPLVMNITLSEKGKTVLTRQAEAYGMTPYYFARLVLARYLSIRSDTDLADLLEPTGAWEPGFNEICRTLAVPETEVLLGGYTEKMWSLLSEMSAEYGMGMQQVFSYVLVRHMEDASRPGLPVKLRTRSSS